MEVAGEGKSLSRDTPYSCLLCTPTGLPLLFTGMWVCCKVAFEDVA